MGLRSRLEAASGRAGLPVLLRDGDGEVALADGCVACGGDAKSNVCICRSKSGSRGTVSAAGSGGRAGGGGHGARETLAQPQIASAQLATQIFQCVLGIGLFLCGNGRKTRDVLCVGAFDRAQAFVVAQGLRPRLRFPLRKVVPRYAQPRVRAAPARQGEQQGQRPPPAPQSAAARDDEPPPRDHFGPAL